ncbi:MAG: ribonuclease P protein component [Lentisphaerae bacterium GWF2_45_14]|nr:MAG: ribonuclease P protein component [Lentisphaerae bacterium GWF2_45_14]
MGTGTFSIRSGAVCSLKYSLNKTDKLRLKSEFEQVREHGTRYVSGDCVLSVSGSPDGRLRCGVVCGKKFSKKSVIRNRARRLLWESFRLLKPDIAICHMVLIPRQGMKGRKQQEIQMSFQRLLKKARLTTD